MCDSNPFYEESRNFERCPDAMGKAMNYLHNVDGATMKAAAAKVGVTIGALRKHVKAYGVKGMHYV